MYRMMDTIQATSCRRARALRSLNIVKRAMAARAMAANANFLSGEDGLVALK